MKYLIIGLLVFSMIGCKDNRYTINMNTADFYGKKADPHPGKKLMEMYCYACHDAKTPEENRLGPPMIAIKMRYIFKDTSKDEFINDIQNWIKNPNEKDAKMFGAVKRFGVMQKLPYPENDIEQIADYIFDNDIEEPEWFQEHMNQNMGKGMKGMR